MGEQHSQKQGLKSSAQKEDRARDAYAELPASSRVAGAFGGNRRSTPLNYRAPKGCGWPCSAGTFPARSCTSNWLSIPLTPCTKREARRTFGNSSARI